MLNEFFVVLTLITGITVSFRRCFLLDVVRRTTSVNSTVSQGYPSASKRGASDHCGSQNPSRSIWYCREKVYGKRMRRGGNKIFKLLGV